MPDPDRHAEPESLALLWEQARPAVFAYVLGAIRDYHAAEDVVQETAVAVAADFHKYDVHRPFLAWATGIARNRILHWYRKQKKDRLILDEATLLTLGKALEGLRRDQLDDRRAALQHCLEQVDGRRRQALELRYTQNLRVAEISRRLGTTANAIKILLHRTRVQLAECIERRLAAAGANG